MQAGDLFSGEPLPFPHDISAHWWAFGAPLGTPFLAAPETRSTPLTPALNEISWRSPNTRDFAGVNRSASSLCKEEGLLRAGLGPSVSGARKPFPGPRGRRGQSVRMRWRPVCMQGVSRGVRTRWSCNSRHSCDNPLRTGERAGHLAPAAN
jgi:hypothetical protein